MKKYFLHSLRRALALLLVPLLLAPSILRAQDGSLVGIVPTDPTLNRVNWAQASHGSSASGGSGAGGFTPSSLLDGVASGTDSYLQLLIPQQQTLVIDLGQERRVNFLQLHLWDRDDRFYRYKIESSLDASEYQTLVDASTGEWKGVQRHEFSARSLRYLRITGLHNSANEGFHLIDELLLVGDAPTEPEAPQQVQVDAKLNGGSSYSVGKKLELNAGVYEVLYKGGAVSAWGGDGSNGGRSWEASSTIAVPLFGKSYPMGLVHDVLNRFATPAQAEAQALEQQQAGTRVTIYLPTAAEVYLYYEDSGPSDNRGSISYELRQISGPNDLLIVRVRDAMTRSVLWQQREVAAWASWVTTGDYNCFGCHIQTQASAGLNDSKHKIPDLPISRALEEKFLQAYPGWQNSAGWVSPFHGGSYVQTQTSLWAWAVSSFDGEAGNRLRGPLIEALNYLLAVRRADGSWDADHPSPPLYQDGSPSATHTAGNIEAISRLLLQLEESDMASLADANPEPHAVDFLNNPGTRIDLELEDIPEVTGIKIRIRDSFASNGNFVLTEIEASSKGVQEKFSSASSNGQQVDYPLHKSYNGTRSGAGDGWAYHPGNVRTQPAEALWNFPEAKQVDRISLFQAHPSHQLKKFELFYTSEPEPTLQSQFQPLPIALVGRFTPPTIYLEAIRKAARVFSSPSWPHARNVVTAAQTIIGLQAALPYLEPDAAAGAQAKVAQVAIDLRKAQRTDGGWSNAMNGSGSSVAFQSAQALRALLLANIDTDIDEPLRRAAEFLLLRQAADGAWVSPPLDRKLAATTWVEIALPTLFDSLKRQLERSVVDDLVAIGLPREVELSWSPIPGAQSYNIYRRLEDTSLERIASGYVSDVVSYRDRNVIDEVTYYYVVRWLDERGNESTDSNEASATPSGLSCGGDIPPVITSRPITGSLPGKDYRYQVEAYDEDLGDELTYSLLAAPSGLTIDPKSGLLSWTPGADDVGSYFVRLKVSDRIGRFATQAYRLSVARLIVNQAPEFISTPVKQVAAGNSYRYLSRALDPNSGDILRYTLESAPQGMSVNPTTGSIRWTPALSLAGQEHAVKLVVTDFGGLKATQEFSISVLANAPPTISSIPVTSIQPFQYYFYAVKATDPEQAALKYSLPQAAPGMRINQNTGAISWTPTAQQLGSYPIRVLVQDPAGASASQEYSLTVEKSAPPLITSKPPSPAVVGRAYTYQVKATDPELGALTYAGVLMPAGMSVSATGLVSWTPSAEQLGLHPVELKVTDNAGLSDSQRFELPVVAIGSPEDPSQNGGPTGGISVSINTPSPGSLISKPTDVLATISDSSGKNQEISWVADLRREADSATPGVQIGAGKGLLTNQLLGKIDPTVLANDAYLLYVTVTRGSTDYSFYFPYDIHTQLKLGEFSLTVTDLVIPLSGLNLEIRRSYSSFDTAKQEFGHGWRLALPGRVVDSALEDPLEPYTANTRVFITKPDGKRVGFTFAPYRFGFPFPFWKAYFRPDPGVTDVLEAGDPLLINSGGQFHDFGDVYNPTQFTLTTRERVRYVIDEKRGLLEVRDANKNTLSFREQGITHSSGVGIKFQRDIGGNIVKIDVPSGNSLRYEYDTRGNLVGFRNTADEQYRYEYSEAHRLLSITDPSGSVVLTNSYASDGRLTSQKDANGNQATALYDPLKRVETVTDRRGFSTKITYDELGGVLERVEPDGAVYSFSYDPNGKLLSSKDPLGHTSRYRYDQNMNLVDVESADGSKTGFRYTSLQQLQEILFSGGERLSFEYDALGRKIRERDFAGRESELLYDSAGRVTSISNSQGAQVRVQYNSAGNATGITSPGRASTALSYDQQGNLLKRVAERTLPNGERRVVETRYEYDVLNRPITVIDAEGRISRTKWNRFNAPEWFIDSAGKKYGFEYDPEGRLLRIDYPDMTQERFEYDQEGNEIVRIDRLGNRFASEYDLRSREVKRNNPDGSYREFGYDQAGYKTFERDENGNLTRFRYDTRGAEVERIDAAGGAWKTQYDANGRLASTIDALGRLTSYRYDELGRVLEIMLPDGSKQSNEYDAAGRRVLDSLPGDRKLRSEYDSLGRLIKSFDENEQVTQYQYDEFDTLIRKIDPSGRELSFWHDNVGRLRRTMQGSLVLEEREYDPLDHLILRRDGNSHTWSYSYDSNGNRIRETAPNGAQTTFTYDALGRMLSYTNPASGTVRMAYDYRGAVQRIEDPKGAIRKFEYDALGNRLSETNRRGLERRFTFDALNRVIEERWFQGLNRVRRRTFAYDAANNKAEERDDSSHYRYTYDQLNRLRTFESLGTFGIPAVLFSQDFDSAGNLIQQIDSLGGAVRSSFDKRGLLSMRSLSVGDAEQAKVQLGYDQAGRVQSIDRSRGLGSALRTEIEYDSRGTESKRTTKRPSGSVLHSLETVIDAGLRLQQERENAELAQYSYDAAGQLTSVDYSTRQDELYSFEPSGNPNAPGAISNQSNQLLEDAEARYHYDEEGNLIGRESKADLGRWEFSYDHSNSLVEALHKTASGQLLDSVRYTYDVRGRRIAQDVNGEQRSFLYSEDEVWAEFDANQQAAVRYLRGVQLDEVVAEYRGDTLQWYLNDRQNSIRATSNDSGTVLTQRLYSAFGIPLNSAAQEAGYGFQGREYEPRTGLNYFRAREYDPRLGRFTSQDPLGIGGGDPNLYRFVGNSPINGTDPFGLEATSSYNTALIPAGGVAASVNTGAVGAQVAGYASIEGIVASANSAIQTAKLVQVYAIAAKDTRLGLTLAKVITTRILVLAGVLGLRGDVHEEIEEPDGWLLERDVWFVDDKPEAESQVTVERKQRRRDCDPNNPRPLYPRPSKMKPHTYPTCESENTCFFDENVATASMLGAYNSGHRLPPHKGGSSELEYWTCFPQAVGDYNGIDPKTKEDHPRLRCALIRIRRNCSYRGYPTADDYPTNPDRYRNRNAYD